MLKLVEKGECIYWRNDNEGFFFIQFQIKIVKMSFNNNTSTTNTNTNPPSITIIINSHKNASRQSVTGGVLLSFQCSKTVFKVCDYVVNVFRADRESYGILIYALILQLLLRKL